jgi:hypothetical protein
MGHQREMEGQGLPTVWATPMVRAFMFWAAWGNVTFAHMLTTQADGLGGHGTPEGNGGAGPANRVGNTEGEGFCVMGCLGKCCFCALLQPTCLASAHHTKCSIHAHPCMVCLDSTLPLLTCSDVTHMGENCAFCAHYTQVFTMHIPLVDMGILDTLWEVLSLSSFYPVQIAHFLF